MKLLIASTNLHKIREFRAIIKNLHKVDLYSLKDFPSYAAPEETGSTFEENAILKAVTAAKECNCWAIADDSGLVVPALGDAPGILSARYAGDKASDAENRLKLILELSTISEEKRTGYFACAIALASPNGLIKCHLGKIEGTILTEPRGNRGFGYDSMFLKYDYGKTFAELEEDLKNRISHRRKAFDRILPTLETIFG